MFTPTYYLLAEGGVIVRPARGEGEVGFIGEGGKGLVEVTGIMEWQRQTGNEGGRSFLQGGSRWVHQGGFLHGGSELQGDRGRSVRA